MKQHTVVFLPSGLSGLVDEGTTLRAAAHSVGEEIETVCGGKGSCGKCKVQILEGREHGIKSGMSRLSPLTESEKGYSARYGLQPDERLSCQARVLGDVAVFVPKESRVARPILNKSIQQSVVDIKPAIRKYFLEIDFCSSWKSISEKLQSDFGVSDLSLDFPLESVSVGEGMTFTVWDKREIVRVELGNIKSSYGVALDIGTTTVAAYLCDLNNGEIISTDTALNPQVRFGEDIMARIAYAREKTNGLVEMKSEIIRAVNELITGITVASQIQNDDIAEVVMVGNTVMHHIFLGLDIAQLGAWPFPPAVEVSVNRKARDLGLAILPSANVHALPIEAAFVGADNVGVMLAEEPYNQDDMLLIIDVGTNGELILGNRERMLSASCATGPAFEGRNIKFGMRAAYGAIDRVRIDPQTLEVSFSVIGKSGWSSEMAPEQIQARGICGSGIIDAVAEMYNAGIVNKDGSFNRSLETSRLRPGDDGKLEFVVAWAEETSIGQDITVVQKDVRAIQLAKAAIYAGSQMMMNRMGVDKPDRIILAGAFGTVIDPKKALALGMLPDCGLESIVAVGNAAGEGALIALLNVDKRAEADKIAREVEYIELTEEPGFNDAFVWATHFPEKK